MDSIINMPRTKRGKETLNSILNSAIQLFYEKGYHATSVKEITSLAGVASGTFYIYFESKYCLYKYLLLRCSHMIRKHLTKAIKNCTTRREAERTGLRAWILFVLKNQYLYHIIWESMYIDQELFKDYYISFCRSYMKGLKPAKEKGELQGIDLEVLSYTLMGAANFLGLRWGIFDEHVQEKEVEFVVEEFMKIIDGGIFNVGKFREEGFNNKTQTKAEPGKLRFHLSLEDEDLV